MASGPTPQWILRKQRADMPSVYSALANPEHKLLIAAWQSTQNQSKNAKLELTTRGKKPD